MKACNRIGVRELRQNLSIYLARVVEGETLEVTDRGRSVALFTPLESGEPFLKRLEREGKLVPAAGDLLDDLRLHKAPRSGWASRELRRQRADRKL